MKSSFLAQLSVALLLSTAACSWAQTTPTLTPAQAQQQLARPGTVLLDVRTPAEFATGHLRGARNVDFLAEDFAAQAAKLDPAAHYVIYCKSGNRAGKAAAALQERGFKHVATAGGFSDLQAAGLPTE